MIEFCSVTFSYGEGVLLDDFSLKVAPGSFLCVIGPSGSGKTTLIRLMLGLERPCLGTVTINGVEPLAARKQGRFSYVPQQASLLPWMSIMENVRMPLKMHSRDHSDQEIEGLLRKVGLEGAAKKRPRQLSGGMQARAALARAWADSSTPLLLLDEPFASLDEIRREELGGLLRDLWTMGGRTIVYITHHISEAILLGTHILPLARGNLKGEVELIAVSDAVRSAETQRARSPLHDELRGRMHPYATEGYKGILELRRAEHKHLEVSLKQFLDTTLETDTRLVAADDLKSLFVSFGENSSFGDPDLRTRLSRELTGLWKATNDSGKARLSFRMADFFPLASREHEEVFAWLLDPSSESLFVRVIKQYIGNKSLLTHAKERIEGRPSAAARRLQVLSLVACSPAERDEAVSYLAALREGGWASDLEPILSSVISKLGGSHTEKTPTTINAKA